MVPPGGFLRGEQFERERVVPPLSRLLCFLSCRSKKGRPRWQALAESRLENKPKGYNRVTITTSKYRPISKPELHRPLAPSVTATPCRLPPGGSYGLLRFHIGFVGIGSVCCESLSQKSEIFASSLWQGSLLAFPFTHPYHPVVEVQADKCPLTPCRLSPARKPLPTHARFPWFSPPGILKKGLLLQSGQIIIEP